MNIKTRFNKLFRPTKSGRSALRDTRIILVLFLVLFILLFASLALGSNRDLLNIPLLNNKRTSNTVPYEFGIVNPTYRELKWEVNFPENYSIKKNDSFETNEFAIFYERGSDTYYVNIYKGEEYFYEEITTFIQSEVISKAEDFKGYNSKIPNSLITYYDYRGQEFSDE